MRKGAEKPLEVSIVRDVIRVRSVRSRVEGEDIGYIRVTQFNEQTTDGLRKALTDISNQVGADKLKGYVLDLRNNPGGLLDPGDLGSGRIPRTGAKSSSTPWPRSGRDPSASTQRPRAI